ncbi:MAG TPA: 3-isopropylmalate dehydratase small subunit [Dehalococcoidia bacterium]|jgi:3-isopropylmalate/(R)-2-methylmalate dehydratase small subunit|nr:3-isopropylmalate dehydratase small subunit [Dehalococcoidia bacterium]
MEKFTVVTGRSIPLNRADVDTDQIIPAKHLKRIERTGFGQFAFESWREDPDFVLNNPAYEGAPILLAGPNFGCGSSREHAPWALEGLGIRAIIAPSFADIFRNNCAKIGLLTVTLGQWDIDRLIARAEETPSAEVTVDLENQTITGGSSSLIFHFDVDPFEKSCLMNGFDAVTLTLLREEQIREFEESRDDAAYPATTA